MHLEGRLVSTYHARWRSYATQISNRTLVVELEVDRRGFVQRARLFECSTGSPELDRAIEAWLAEKGMSLRVTSGTFYFLVRLP